MEREVDEPCRIEDLVAVEVVGGSSHPAVYRPGTPVALELEAGTARVVTTRGGGAIKLGYVAEPYAARLARCLAEGYRYTGKIAGVAHVSERKVVYIRLDPPLR